MCVHIHSRVISFLIPPASTSAPGPLVDKETGIHWHFRRQELVNSNGFRVGMGEIHSCHPKKELGAQRLVLRSTREFQIHWEIRRSEVAAGEGRKWCWVYKVSFWLCGFQLDLPVGEAAGSGSCLLSHLSGLHYKWGSPLPQLTNSSALSNFSNWHCPWEKVHHTGYTRSFQTGFDFLFWGMLETCRLWKWSLSPYWFKANCLTSLNFIFLICKMKRITTTPQMCFEY